MTENHDELAKGVPYSEMTRAVAAARPDLIEAMERASEGFYRHEEFWQAETARQQRAGGLPEQHLESPYGRALRKAAVAVKAAFNKRNEGHDRTPL